MPQFARALLALQNGADIADFIDGMDLDERWGEENINYDDLQAKTAEWTVARNAEPTARGLIRIREDRDYRQMWNDAVRTKDRRIEPLKQGRYKTRWRSFQNNTDPRLRDRDV